jgi:uncharacterized membrane protein YhaH (DUF805 family)
MFKAPFSFEGRIRRTEYGLSFIIYVILATIINQITKSSNRYSEDSGGLIIVLVLFIPMLWFLLAQGVKRSHDVGNSGWWVFIPFYGLYLLFADGELGANIYGDNPKGLQNSSQQLNFNQTLPPNTGVGNQTGYQGGYSGGHNNPNNNQHGNQNSTNSGEYQSGDLYR